MNEVGRLVFLNLAVSCFAQFCFSLVLNRAVLFGAVNSRRLYVGFTSAHRLALSIVAKIRWVASAVFL